MANDLQAVVADKGSHSPKVVALAADLGMRASIPERASPNQRRWADKDRRRWSRPWPSGRAPSAAHQQAVRDTELDLGHGPLGNGKSRQCWRFSGRQMLPSFSQPDRSQIDHSGDRTGGPRSERASAGSATTFSISSKRR